MPNRDVEMDPTDVNYVLSTRDAVTPWSTERQCALGDPPVYTSMEYSVDVLIVCDRCFSSLPENPS